MEKKKINMRQMSEAAEARGFKMMKSCVDRLVSGIFIFKKRKGEVVAGAATFFTLLSFGPFILLLISIIGLIIDDHSLAKSYVLNGIHASIPKVDPWIMNNLENLIESQLESGFSVLQIVFLTFTCMGISTSLVFGINTISKVDPDGGLIGDDVKSLLAGVFIGFFLMVLIILFQGEFIRDFLSAGKNYLGFVIPFIDSGVLASFMSLIFFTFYYKLTSSIKVSIKDCFFGSLTFIGCFFIGRSGYWLYLKYFKADLVSDYGHFYNFMIGLIWVYFLMCAFFYGASVAYVNKVSLFSKRKV